MPNLKLEHVYKIYPNGTEAVKDFNLEINDGDFVILVGPSGCGKSTTLRMIAGLEDISKGSLYIDSKLSNQLSPKERGIAMVFQSYALYPQLSVYDNLGFGLTLEGLDEDVIDQRVRQVAQVLGLTDYLERKPRELSGGQRQRVAVGRAIIRKVSIFLMDEPLSNLDAKQRVTMRSEIIDLHRKIGATTIYVTHDQTEAMTMADKIVIMKDGVIQQVGTPKDLYFKPHNRFVASFIGEPPMNIIDCFNHDGLINFINSSLLLKVPSLESIYSTLERFSLGFRPEAIELVKSKGREEGYVYFESEVELTEMLGDNANIYTMFGTTSVILKCDPHEIPKIGGLINYRVKESSLYLFDEEGNVIYSHE